jgi:hypothetical protein
VSGEARLRRRPGVLWRRSLAAVVLLPPEADDVITLAGTGPAVWDLLADWRTVPELVEALAGAFATDPAVVEADLTPILGRLEANRALEIAAHSGGPNPE